MFMMTIPLRCGTIARVLVIVITLELHALAAVEAGESGMLRGAYLVLVLAADAGMALRVHLIGVHSGGALAVLSVN